MGCSDLGVTVSTLPVSRGYYRASARSSLILRCSDSGAGCGVRTECANSTSGCLGGEDFALACQPGLTGIFCKLCDPLDSPNSTYPNNASAVAVARMYYVGATATDVAHCEACGGTAATAIGAGVGFAVLIVSFVLLAKRSTRQFIRPDVLAHVHRLWHLFTLATKVKIVIGFYMIASKISRIYEVELLTVGRLIF